MKKLSSFFKILNKKIDKYDKLATNPFTKPQRIVIVWIEDGNEPPQSNTYERYENN